MLPWVSVGTSALPMITIDTENNPNLHFRIDNFSVPDAAREEFEEAMRRNMALANLSRSSRPC